MSEDISPRQLGKVPEDTHEVFLSDVQAKVGHVAKFGANEKRNDLEENLLLEQLSPHAKGKASEAFVGLSKEVITFH